MSAFPMSSIGPVGHRPWIRTGRLAARAWHLVAGCPLLRLVLIMIGVTAAFLLIRSTAQRQRSRAAENKLTQRYAAGYITEDEYRERLSVLRVHER